MFISMNNIKYNIYIYNKMGEIYNLMHFTKHYKRYIKNYIFIISIKVMIQNNNNIYYLIFNI